MSPVLLPRLKAPRNHGELLIHPPLETVGDLLRDNRDRLGGSILGWPIAELRDRARREVFDAACQYLTAAGEPVPNAAPTWLVAGHQPELFHPGVWVKNFLLHRLARQHEALALNLVVDNDIAKSPALRVPTNDRVVSIPFDERRGEMPFEERTVADEATFDSLPARVEPLTRDWPFRPWADGVWNEMRRAAKTTPLLGERIVRARRALERSMGLTPFEVPLSAICRTTAFANFACSLLNRPRQFFDVYNAAVREYRLRHGLSSTRHPVPDLTKNGDAYEMPFWVWQNGSPRRQRLFAVVDKSDVLLFAGTTPLAQFRGGPEAWIDGWPSLEAQGIKVRTRALTTTLFVRLLLADLFMHGIGGGKYDEVTDTIIERHFQIRPPHYLVATATLLLPFPREPAGSLDAKRLALLRQEREYFYNPQRHLDGAGERKRLAIAMPETTHAERVARFRELQDATAELRPFTAERLAETKRELGDLERRRHRDELLGARDYSFCLYPEEMLRAFMMECTHLAPRDEQSSRGAR